MSTSYFLAVFHIIALPVGLGGIWMRARSLSRVASGERAALESALAADNFWGISAVLWLGTGVARAFFGFEKGWAYYSANPLFWTKMTLFGLVLALEIAPMISLIRWRITMSRGGNPDLSRARIFSRISFVEAGVVVAIIFLAAGIARGLGM